jgi:thiol-disulfide isomerase/thioredoxin
MKKFFTLFAFILFGSSLIQAQLPDGSIAPNWTATDLDGNTWTLYDVLDQGKTVIIDLSATWCGPCWSYHESGALENLYEMYGPDGTDELMVFMIEGDASTNVDCLYDLPGCNSSTTGNWVEGTPYPIINDDDIADLYALSYWPTIYTVCPSRILVESSQVSTVDHYALLDNCLQAYGENNAGFIEYDGLDGSFCGSATFVPTVTIQNLGSNAVTSMTVEFWMDGSLSETQNWTGEAVALWGFIDVAFAELTVSENATFQFIVTTVNGVADEDASNNSYSAVADITQIDQNILTIELMTDDYPGETYWELTDDNGNAFYTGGNALVVGGTDGSGTYDGQTLYEIEVPLPGDGCYQFNIYDSYGDGLTDVGGWYKVVDQGGNIIFENAGTGFDEERKPFEVFGSTDVISNNAAIVAAAAIEGEFCGEATVSPSITMQNLGTNTITEMEIIVYNSTGVLSTTNWTGTIESAQYGFVDLEPVTTTEVPLVISINSINGETDNYNFGNSLNLNFLLSAGSTESNEFTLELQVDSYGYEIYWQFANSSGEVFASGGNEVVGPDGGGATNSSPDDAGAYEAGELIFLPFTVPAGATDCYDLLVVDGYGDGMVDGGGGYVKLWDVDFNLVYEKDFTDDYFNASRALIEVKGSPDGTNEVKGLDGLILYPNPVQNNLNVEFDLKEDLSLNVEVINILGESVKSMSHQDFMAGANKFDINVSELSNGMYYLQIANESQRITKKFTIVNN